jgi:hypothetical protein
LANQKTAAGPKQRQRLRKRTHLVGAFYAMHPNDFCDQHKIFIFDHLFQLSPTEKLGAAESDPAGALTLPAIDSAESGSGAGSKKSFFFQKVSHGIGGFGTLLDPVFDSFCFQGHLGRIK